jgi:alkylation response protein AidB-like acyl-CoA dehydrogenase
MIDDLQAGVRTFLERESPPELVKEQDEKHVPPVDLLRRFGELGFLAVGLPEEWGGAGDITDVALMMEQLGYFNQGLAHLVGRSMYGLQNLIHFGTDAQRQDWIPRLLSGEVVFGIGMTEPNAGSDAAAIETRAALDGDGWLVNGTKVFTSSGSYAGLIMLSARTAPPEERHAGITLFLVDGTTPGITATKLDTIGYWSTGVYQMFYDDVRLPADAVLGEVGGGWGLLRQHLIRERMTIASRAVGAMREVLEQSVIYATQRRQFGKPIADFQAVAHKLADIRIDYQMARTAAHTLAQQMAAGNADATDAAVVKTFVSEAWVRCADRAMQIFGGYGYTHDFPIQRHFRDSRVAVIGGGTSEIMRNLISRDLVRGRA